jgi:hypothetical protein
MPNSKTTHSNIIALVVGAVLIALLSFAAGIHVGFKKAKFSYKWGENYERNFMGPRPGMMGPGFMDRGPMGFFREFGGKDFRNAHGLSGTIISIADNKLIIKDRDEKENTVSATDKTIIKQRRDTLKISDLKTGNIVVVVGNPDDSGVINADIIRVFDTQIN